MGIVSNKIWWSIDVLSKWFLTKSLCPRGVPNILMPWRTVGTSDPRQTQPVGYSMRAIRSRASHTSGFTPDPWWMRIPATRQKSCWSNVYTVLLRSGALTTLMSSKYTNKNSPGIKWALTASNAGRWPKENKQDGHHGTPLFSSFALHDIVDSSFIVFLPINGCCSVKHRDERHRCCVHFVNALHHGRSRDEIVRTDPNQWTSPSPEDPTR